MQMLQDFGCKQGDIRTQVQNKNSGKQHLIIYQVDLLILHQIVSHFASKSETTELVSTRLNNVTCIKVVDKTKPSTYTVFSSI